jgi:hypothetical protein
LFVIFTKYFYEVEIQNGEVSESVMDILQKFGAESEAKRLLATPVRGRDNNIVT